jgi:hypothetical protein
LAPDNPQQSIGDAVAEISERAALLVREEIELAKAEVTEKLSRLIKGVVIASAAGVFIITGLLFVLHAFAWLGAVELFNGNEIYWGFFLVAAFLFILGGVAGWLAAKALRSSKPPTPEMAIDEARRIRDTVTAGAQPWEQQGPPPGARPWEQRGPPPPPPRRRG